MRKILLLILVITNLGCNDSKNEFQSEFPNYKLQSINFLEKRFYLPANYQNASLDSIFQSKFKLTNSLDSLPLNNKKFLRLHNSGGEFEYFIDSKNPENTITFILGEYTSLSEKTMNIFVDMLQMNFSLDAKEQNQEFKLKQKKFYNLSYADVIKVKFLRLKNQDQLYVTQYLITKGLKTMTMIVTNSENEDYDELIKNFKI
ncbi:hypothetical protein [Christiangramia sp. SM2212]|uniref:Lipoprotein n=1 Tax=Christiangramia sediminicola TaxID=3073267 RepID=A0ABU1ENG9_9FLAO|nr:hypothetical protein [Christiangramia sp. SM2212]MDR5589935.1 hypothetical protein [Christiangramia sp. SM2212]